MHFGWTSRYVPVLKTGNYKFKLSIEECSNLNAVLLFGHVIGAIGFAIISDYVSKKEVIVVSLIPFLLSWLFIGIASSAPFLFIGRFVAGISGGLIYPAVAIYLLEISGHKTKSTMKWSPISLWTGILLMYLLSTSMPINISSFVAVAISVLIFSLFAYMPESPYYYLSKENDEQALRSLKSLRGSEDIMDEMKRMTAVVMGNENKIGFSDLFTVKTNRQTLLICLGEII